MYDEGSIQKEEYKLDLSSEITVSQEILGIAENFLSETSDGRKPDLFKSSFPIEKLEFLRKVSSQFIEFEKYT